jgi:chemosensory pili system protein ChpA (sensor histidine kinase/response regulator)
MLNKELLEFFLTEAEEHIGQLEKGFLELEQNPSDTTGIQELFRSAHTLKGSAALVKLNTLSEIAHKMEDVLESVRDRQITVTKKIVDWFLLSLDSIKLLISETVNGRPEKAELTDEVCSALEHALPEKAGEYCEIGQDIVVEEATDSTANEEADMSTEATERESCAAEENIEEEGPVSEEDRSPDKEAAPADEETESENVADQDKEVAPADKVTQKEKMPITGRKEDLQPVTNFVKVNVNDLENMMGLVGELTIFKNFFVSETEGAKQLKSEIEYASRRLLKEIDDFSSRYAHSAPEKMSIVDHLLEDFRELEFDRYDGINLFANRINEITSDIDEALKSISVFFDQFSKHARRLDKLNWQFRDLISSSRMVETGKLFQRFTRIVRDLSGQSGKEVSFIVRGGQTRIDKMLYERLFTPLLHLVRNAFSHGIESPEDRRASKKPEEGRIVLSAMRDGNSILIDIQDDGRGINLNKIRQKAVTKGIVKEGTDVSPAQLFNMLFIPGFTTHDEIDMTSGRGVGLDAVRQIISEINGTISIATEEGKGTIFRIKLPLTLIVVNTVKFRAGGLEFSVPSGMIQELMDIDVKDYDRVKGTIKLGDEEQPVKDLCNLLNLNPMRHDTRMSVIVFNLMSGKENAIIVDEIVGMEDTVIKPLGNFLEGLTYCSGVSISADGKLVPVINPLGLLGVQIEAVEIVQVPLVEEQGNTVLLVDDSLSVRKFAGMILEQKGYEVITAPNGLEALNILEEKHVDLILTDLEMPVMHGYELLRELKRRGLLEFIPVVVLTSRSSEKHREKAASLGAKDYLVKPFEEATLVETIRQHLKGKYAATG